LSGAKRHKWFLVEKMGSKFEVQGSKLDSGSKLGSTWNLEL
jgi:hypothetical protein